MTTKKLNLFIPITKVDEENRLVYGVLAAEELDNSGEIFDYETSKPLFEKWSDDQFEASKGLSKGNVRAMHVSIAAGKLTDISYDDAAKTIEGCAKVVDDGEWQKVLEGVYTGFSMGGRYAKRWQDNGNTRYTAQPVEVSLVDKPCIKSALFSGLTKSFMLQKADGTVEERLFKTGTEDMYVPTNDEILPVAQSLAKADGKTDADWLEYADAARDQIIAEKGDAVPAPAEESVAKADGEHTDADCKVENCDKCAGMAEKVATGGEPVAEDTDTGGEGPEGPEATDGAGDTAAKVEAPSKVTSPGIRQLWNASDGTAFEKKADCEAHEATLVKAEPTLAEQVAAATSTIVALAKGDDIPAILEAALADDEPLDVRLGKFTAFLSDPEVLEKSIWNVSRMASIMADVASLYVAVKAEADREGDGSGVPATLMSSVEGIGNALIDMATEEVGELMERLRTGEGTEASPYCYSPYYCDLAVSTMGLEKADTGAFFDKAISIAGKDQARLQKIHDHSIALGAVCAEEDDATADAEVGAEAEKLAKAAGFETGAEFLADLQKRAAELDELKPQVAGLLKSVEDLKAVPRGPAPRTSVVEKGADIELPTGGGKGVTPGSVEDRVQKAMAHLEGLSGPELSRAMIKVAQSNGVSVSLHQ